MRFKSLGGITGLGHAVDPDCDSRRVCRLCDVKNTASALCKMGWRISQKGHPRQERIPLAPDDIDHALAYELSLDQTQGLIRLDEWFVLQQVDLAEKLYVATEHRARKYLDPRTGRTVIAPLPEAVKAASLVGPKLSALGPIKRAMATCRTARFNGSGTRCWGSRSAAGSWSTSSRRHRHRDSSW